MGVRTLLESSVRLEIDTWTHAYLSSYHPNYIVLGRDTAGIWWRAEVSISGQSKGLLKKSLVNLIFFPLRNYICHLKVSKYEWALLISKQVFLSCSLISSLISATLKNFLVVALTFQVNLAKHSRQSDVAQSIPSLYGQFQIAGSWATAHPSFPTLTFSNLTQGCPFDRSDTQVSIQI